MQQIIFSSNTWSSLQKSMSKFTPKKFYKIDPWKLFQPNVVFAGKDRAYPNKALSSFLAQALLMKEKALQH
jgi:hypothetical protein